MAACLLVAAIDDGDGDLGSVFRGGEDALRCIEGAIEAAGHFLLLAQDGLVGGDLQLIDRGGRDQRLVTVAVACGGEVRIGAAVHGVDRLRQRDLACRAKRAGFREGRDLDVRQAVRACADGGEGGKEIDVLEHHVVAMGNQLAPVACGRLSDRRGDEAEVASGVVDADVEEAVAMVGVVLDVVAAGLDERPGGEGIRCGEEVRLAGGVAADFEQDELADRGSCRRRG